MADRLVALVNITRGTLNVLAFGPAATLAELAGVPELAKGFGIPPEATITHIGVNHNYGAGGLANRQAELTIGWEMPK